MRQRVAGVVEQPGATPGQRAYCPVSGVVFDVSAQSARRDARGGSLYFCCEACAAYFTQHEARVRALRRL